MHMDGSAKESQGFELGPFLQNLNGVLTLAAPMRPRNRYAGSGGGHAGKILLVLPFSVAVRP